MADAAASDAAGPSSATETDIEQELKRAEASFQQGIQAIKVQVIPSDRQISRDALSDLTNISIHLLRLPVV